MNEKAKEREIQREIIHGCVIMLLIVVYFSLPDKVIRLTEIRLLLAGWFLSGKTWVGDIILGIPLGERRRTYQSEVRQGQVGRWMVRLVDTPGWLRRSFLKDTPEIVKQEITRGVSLCTPGPHTIILVVSTAVAFTKVHLSSIKEHMNLLGPDVWRHTLVLFSWCDSLETTTVEEFIEGEGSALHFLLKKCNNRYHSFNINSNNPAQVTQLLEKIEWMATENSIFYPNVDETDKWEEETVTEAMSPPGESLFELFVNFCKERAEDLVMSIRKILIKQEKACSISEPPDSKYCLSKNEITLQKICLLKEVNFKTLFQTGWIVMKHIHGAQKGVSSWLQRSQNFPLVPPAGQNVQIFIVPRL